MSDTQIPPESSSVCARQAIKDHGKGICKTLHRSDKTKLLPAEGLGLCQTGYKRFEHKDL